MKEAEVRRSALALLGRKEEPAGRELMLGRMLRCATANVKVQYAGPIATALHTALGRSRPVARGSNSRCEAAKQAILVAHRWLPAAQPWSASLPSSRSHRSGCSAAVRSHGRGWRAEGEMQASHSFRTAHAVSRKGEDSRDWLAAPQPSPAASLFINQGEHVGACPCQPLQSRLTRAAIPSDACSS